MKERESKRYGHRADREESEKDKETNSIKEEGRRI